MQFNKSTVSRRNVVGGLSGQLCLRYVENPFNSQLNLSKRGEGEISVGKTFRVLADVDFFLVFDSIDTH